MAIVKTEIFNGILIENAYHKVKTVSLDFINKMAEVSVNIYFNSEQREENPRSPFRTEKFLCYATNPVGTTFEEFFGTPTQQVIPAKAAYLFLKSLPEYENAIDV